MSTKQEDTTRGGPVSSRSGWAFDCDVDTAPTSHVRQLVRNLLGDRYDTVVDDAVLVADELVTNALRHAAAPRRCRIGLTAHDQRLRIEVDDAAPDRDPHRRTPDRSGGRGLVLLDKLTSSWGVDYQPGHKTVWAELALNRPGSDGNARHLTVVRTHPRLSGPTRQQAGGPPGPSLASTGVSEPDTNPPPAGLHLTHRVVDGVPVVEAAGEVDAATAPQLRAAVTAALDQAPGVPCVLDLTAVTFLGSSGLTALIDVTLHAQARDEPFRIVVDATRPVIRPIQLTGLDRVLALYHTVQEALA